MKQRNGLEETVVLTLNDTNSNEQPGIAITQSLKEINFFGALIAIYAIGIPSGKVSVPIHLHKKIIYRSL